MISMDKQYQTRDGRAVRIYAVDGGGALPVHGAIRGADPAYERWFPEEWTRNGETSNQAKTVCDLIEVKPRITRTYWLAHARAGGVSQICGSVEQALVLLSPNSTYLLAITGPHHVEFCEGDGL